MWLRIRRFLAAACLAGGGALAAATAGAAAVDDVWVPAGPLPARPDAPVFALAADPAGGGRLLAGTATGAVLRSADGGATWSAARPVLGAAVAALAFDPARPGVALAGTRGDGVWRSGDAGATWQREPGTESRTVRAFAFWRGAALAGTDQGVLVGRDGGPWTPTGLAQVRVSALAATDDATGPLLVAGGDATQGGEALPVYVSGDGGRTWSPAASAGGSTMVAALSAAGPLLMGTDAGLFASADRGATWQRLTGGGVLPATDFSARAAAPRHPERLYVASDGGGSDRGGLWSSSDGGAHFTALAPPQPELTALVVSADDVPEVVVATFRPADHAIAVWTYRDAVGEPAGTAPSPVPSARPAPSRPPAVAGRPATWRALLAAPETPFLAVAAVCLAAVAAALAAYVRRGRPR